MSATSSDITEWQGVDRISGAYKCGWILGASGGIARGILPVISRTCRNMALVDRSLSSEIIEPLQQPSRKLFYCEEDLSSELSLRSFATQATEHCGTPDVLVVAAGQILNTDVVGTDAETADSLYENNLRLAFLAIRQFLSCCSSDPTEPKSIIIVSSNAAFVSRPQQAFYAALKAAICSLVKSAAKHYGPIGVRVNAIAPGRVWVNRNDREVRASLQNPPIDASRPLGRILLPKDLCSTFQLLLDPQGLVTGQTIVVDGGSSL
jgi:NAD(P)-dependent dehydrogenase (short-subunit alcohol dehydrogenase family)